MRPAGLYALERLAQNNPGQRQTIVDVICAYLRMPYIPSTEEAASAEPAVPRAAIAGVSASAGRDPHDDCQVRLTAQRILIGHLGYAKRRQAVGAGRSLIRTRGFGPASAST
ncbi:hypothetical protein [Nonomuraea jabiensis]|uniref:hypothetical protein n=1 Tax=Nonomuraea jabiensis TaxID=882448 RepID=UPI003D718B20